MKIKFDNTNTATNTTDKTAAKAQAALEAVTRIPGVSATTDDFGEVLVCHRGLVLYAAMLDPDFQLAVVDAFIAAAAGEGKDAVELARASMEIPKGEYAAVKKRRKSMNAKKEAV